MTKVEALKQYDHETHDLVLVNSSAKPPFARIRLKEDLTAKKEATQPTAVVKRLEIRDSISPHDLEIKLRKGTEFLAKGLRVEVIVNAVRGGDGFTEVIAKIQNGLQSAGVKLMSEQKGGKTYGVTFVPDSAKKKNKVASTVTASSTSDVSTTSGASS